MRRGMAVIMVWGVLSNATGLSAQSAARTPSASPFSRDAIDRAIASSSAAIAKTTRGGQGKADWQRVRQRKPGSDIYLAVNGGVLEKRVLIESDDAGPITVRSALELLGAAYALHPAFAEAEILDAGAGVRPAFPDNVPAIVVRGRAIHVNGLYRHGFLLAPPLAVRVADYLENGTVDARVFRHEIA